MILVLIGTPVALASGATAVTVGAAPREAPPVPKICVPPPPPHPAANTLSNRTVNHLKNVEQLSIFFIGSLSMRSGSDTRWCTQTIRTAVFLVQRITLQRIRFRALPYIRAFDLCA